jgi:hypothetical protein
LLLTFFSYKVFTAYPRSERQVVENLYHAHYTANLIEDEIRKIRKEDYTLRSKYDEERNALLGKAPAESSGSEE